MSLLSLAQRWLPFLARSKPNLPRHETLALRPIRNPVITWERKASQEAGDDPETSETPPGIVLAVPRREDRTGKVLSRLFQMPPGRKIELDEFGAEIWELCDGAHSVEQLIKQTCDKYKLNRRQGEVSVTAFMRMLAQRRLIGFGAAAKGVNAAGKELSHGNGKRGTSAGKRRQPGRVRRH